jgi:hypothetical protein
MRLLKAIIDTDHRVVAGDTDKILEHNLIYVRR